MAKQTKKSTPTLADLDLEGTGFVVEPLAPENRLIMAVYGAQKSGKTRLALTAPGPIVYQALDPGLEGVVEEFEAAGKVIAKRIYDVSLPDSLRPRYDAKERKVIQPIQQQVVDHIERRWEEFCTDYRAGLRSKARTMVWDTGSDIWDFMRLARHGKLTQVQPKDHQAVNYEMTSMIRAAFDYNKNLIILGRTGDEWTDREGGGSRKTGATVKRGFKDIPAIAQVVITMERVIDEDGNVNFMAKVEDCRHNKDVMGMVLENTTFPEIAVAVKPESSNEDWE